LDNITPQNDSNEKKELKEENIEKIEQNFENKEEKQTEKETKTEEKKNDPFDNLSNKQTNNNQGNIKQNREYKKAQEQPKKKSNAWIWAIGIGCGGLVVCFVLFFLFVMLLASAGSKSKSSNKTVFNNPNYNFVMGEQSSKNRILEIPVVGAIMDDQSDNIKKNLSLRIKENLKIASEDNSVRAIIFTIDSPGGGITPTDIIWNDIKKFKAKRKIPVITYCENITASGGYYIASSTDYIMATETSLVGSIGVISQFMEMEKLFDKLGIKWNVITSNKSNGNKSFKDMGSFTRKMTPEEKAFFQSLVQEMWNKFVDVVAEGRKGKLTREQVANLADGRIYTGKTALKLGLIDGVGYKEDAFNKAKEMANLDSAQLVNYKPKLDYFKDLFESKNESPIPSVKTLIEGQTPQFMYMWTAGGSYSEN
ncbi:signal peptide peptidase SppA, partial [bacterium]|nr:signal peptide peptidase SppA [bacterium]